MDLYIVEISSAFSPPGGREGVAKFGANSRLWTQPRSRFEVVIFRAFYPLKL
jgi:hypothetical protein